MQILHLKNIPIPERFPIIETVLGGFWIPGMGAFVGERHHHMLNWGRKARK